MPYSTPYPKCGTRQRVPAAQAAGTLWRVTVAPVSGPPRLYVFKQNTAAAYAAHLLVETHLPHGYGRVAAIDN